MPRALGMIETRGLIGSIEAADVRLVTQEKIDGALVSVLVEGDVGAVQAAADAGKEAADRVGELIASHVIPHPDEGIEGILKKEEPKEKPETKAKPPQKNKGAKSKDGSSDTEK